MTTPTELTQPDVARLMGLLTYSTTKFLILTIDSEVASGRLTWEPYRGKADTFGRSLAQQIRGARRLSPRQINAAKGRLLQRNWERVKDVMVRGLVSVPAATLESATDPAHQAPTYSQRRGAGAAPATTPTRTRRRTGRTRTPVVVPTTPVVVTQARVCGKRLAYSRQRCTRSQGHPLGCIGERPNTPPSPTNDVDSVLGDLGGVATPNLPASRPEVSRDVDPSVARFLLLDLDDGTRAYVEPDYDPSVERFKLLDIE